MLILREKFLPSILGQILIPNCGRAVPGKDSSMFYLFCSDIFVAIEILLFWEKIIFSRQQNYLLNLLNFCIQKVTTYELKDEGKTLQRSNSWFSVTLSNTDFIFFFLLFFLYTYKVQWYSSEELVIPDHSVNLTSQLCLLQKVLQDQLLISNSAFFCD